MEVGSVMVLVPATEPPDKTEQRRIEFGLPTYTETERESSRKKAGQKKSLTSAAGYNIEAVMNIQTPVILTIASVAIWLPNGLSAEELKEAKVTQVVQDVKVLPSGAAARRATVNETVHKGSAVQTGVQSRSVAIEMRKRPRPVPGRQGVHGRANV